VEHHKKAITPLKKKAVATANDAGENGGTREANRGSAEDGFRQRENSPKGGRHPVPDRCQLKG